MLKFPLPTTDPVSHFKNVEEAFQYLRNHEIETNCRYATYRATKNFGKNSLDIAKKVYWQDPPNVTYGRMSFTGVPYVILGQKIYDCRFGKNRKKSREKERANKYPDDKKAARYRSGSLKINCPARCVFREIGRFPKYQVPKETSEYEKQTIGTELLDRIYNGKLVDFERVIVAHLAKKENHNCMSRTVDPCEEAISEPIDPRLAKKIQELCYAGVRKVPKIMALLKIYVQEIFAGKLPDPSNKRFYPNSKCISNHIYKSMKQIKRDENTTVETLDQSTHPSVRIKGTETNYVPAQCFDPLCLERSVHMHCPLCEKAEYFIDPEILQAHYRVRHVDKGVEFAGLKILRCCDKCNVVGTIKEEKILKVPHWHCFRCHNGFTKRDEALKHYKTHFINPQTTFQIKIAQDINQPVPVTQYETEQATSCIPTDSFSVHSGLTDSVTTHTSSMSVLPRGLEGMVAMPGVGAMETVGISDTQTIMIIQDDGQGNQTMQELYTAQESDPPDLSALDDVEDTYDETVKQLRGKIAQLEKEKANQTAHIAILSKKIKKQSEEIAAYKLREQDLLEQMQQLQEEIDVPQDTVIAPDTMIQSLCNKFETQHKQLIRQQMNQLKHSLVKSSVNQKMIASNSNSLGAQLGQTVNLQTFDSSGDKSAPVSMSPDFSSPAKVNVVNSVLTQTSKSDLEGNSTARKINSVPTQTSKSDLEGNSTARKIKVTSIRPNFKRVTLLKDSKYKVQVRSLSDDDPKVNNDNSGEPQAKKRKETL